MNKVSKLDLKQLPIFDIVCDSTLNLLVDKAFRIKLSKGETLFAEKDKVDRVYMVLNGKVTMYRNSEDGQKRVIYILNSGNFINEVILDELPASISCEAFEDSYVIYFFKEDLIQIMSKDFEFTQIIINSMGRKIRRLYRQLKNAVPIKMDKKLAAKLWKLSKDYGIKTTNGVIINLNLSITYLADMLGSTRETISRCISNFEKMGMIKFKDKKIVVRDLEELSLYFRGK